MSDSLTTKASHALVWVSKTEASQRIKAAKELGITLVDRRTEGKQVRLRFAIPAGVTFDPSGK